MYYFLSQHIFCLYRSAPNRKKTAHGFARCGTVSGSHWVSGSPAERLPERLLPYCRWFQYSLRCAHQYLHFQVNRPFWFFQPLSPPPLTDLVTSLTGIFTKKTMTSSCLSPPVLLSSPITSLSWFSSTSSSLHPMQCLSRPGTAQPWTITPSDPIFRPDLHRTFCWAEPPGSARPCHAAQGFQPPLFALVLCRRSSSSRGQAREEESRGSG